MKEIDQLSETLSMLTKEMNSAQIDPDDVDYDKANGYIPFFKTLDSLNTSSIIVLDYFKRSYFYASENFYNIFGFEKESILGTSLEQLRKRIHPEDFIINIAAIKARQFIYSQHIEKRKDFKFTQEVRFLNDKKKYIRCIIQSSNIELDAKGHFWLNMCLCDLAPKQDINTPGSAVLWNTVTGEPIFSQEGKNINLEHITPREKEVLSLIANGMKSNDIAQDLFISVNTVNNHRRNLIEKLNVANTTEAVKQAIKLGII